MKHYEIKEFISNATDNNIQLTLVDGSILIGISLVQSTLDALEVFNLWDLKRNNSIDYLIDGNEIDFINFF